MDNYPAHLAPEFNEGGGVSTPFGEWWDRVKGEFPTVPDSVARYWLHEHWGHSPYRWLPSRDYQFSLMNWPLADLQMIRSRWDGFSIDGAECREHGDHQLRRRILSSTAKHMVETGYVPAPIILLDNRDDHLSKYPEAIKDRIPPGIILIEGHRRFNLCLSLQAQGKLKGLRAWLMLPS